MRSLRKHVDVQRNELNSSLIQFKFLRSLRIFADNLSLRGRWCRKRSKCGDMSKSPVIESPVDGLFLLLSSRLWVTKSRPSWRCNLTDRHTDFPWKERQAQDAQNVIENLKRSRTSRVFHLDVLSSNLCIPDDPTFALLFRSNKRYTMPQISRRLKSAIRLETNINMLIWAELLSTII